MHRAKGQMQLGLSCRRLSAEDADTLYYALTELSGVRSASVLYRTGQVLLTYDMTFLVLLLSAMYEPQESRRMEICVAHPVRKHFCWEKKTGSGRKKEKHSIRLVSHMFLQSAVFIWHSSADSFFSCSGDCM